VETKTFFKPWEAFNEVASPIFQPIQSEREYEETLELFLNKQGLEPIQTPRAKHF
jgi:hypothetical protein